jgi:hypothetical protein
VKALADAAAEHRCRKADAASAELNLAKVQHRKDALAKEQCQRAALAKAKRRKDALADEERQRAERASRGGTLSKLEEIVLVNANGIAKLRLMMYKNATSIMDLSQTVNNTSLQVAVEPVALALVKEGCRHKAVLAAEAGKWHQHEAAAWAVEPKALTLDEECCHHEAVTWALMSAVSPLEDKQSRHKAADRPITSDDVVIEHIWTEFALCAAPLDAILAKIACNEAAFETTLSPCRPTSYVDKILSNMGGGTQPSLPLAVLPSALVSAALPLSEVDGQLQTVRPRAQSCHRTG